MKKRLWQIFGPIVLAGALVLGILLTPWHFGDLNSATMQKAAVSMAPNILSSKRIKSQALASGYVPFFGSSELARMDPFHPSVLAAKYHRSYRPFLNGSAGTQSLAHFVNDQSMLTQLRGKKIVFILSLQWFTKGGQRGDAFDYYYSPLQMIDWLQRADPHSAADRYAAKRLLTMPSVRDSGTVAAATRAIADGKHVAKHDQWVLNAHEQILSNEDALFSRFNLINNVGKIKAGEKVLPAHATYAQLTKLAEQVGKAHTTNNKLGIDNKFFSTRLGGHKLAAQAGSQAHFDYIQSPEYSDFQLLLEQFAKYHINVQFIIPPINQKWAQYTKLSLPMVRTSARKVKAQLANQGFTHVLDLSNDGAKPYFMQDTIHLGWAGWVAVDKAVDPFLTKSQPAPHYTISDTYLSKNWQNATGGF